MAHGKMLRDLFFFREHWCTFWCFCLFKNRLITLTIMNIFCFSIGNFIIPTDELIFFRGVETTNQFIFRGWMSFWDVLPETHDVFFWLKDCSPSDGEKLLWSSNLDSWIPCHFTVIVTGRPSIYSRVSQKTPTILPWNRSFSHRSPHFVPLVLPFAQLIVAVVPTVGWSEAKGFGSSKCRGSKSPKVSWWCAGARYLGLRDGRMRDGERKEKTKTCKKTLEKRREIKKHEPIFNFIYIYI